MKSPSHAYVTPLPDNDYTMDQIMSKDVHGSSHDEKLLPSAPPPPPPPPPRPVPAYHYEPLHTLPEVSPLTRSNHPVRRRRGLFCCLIITAIIVVIVIFLCILYGIPASHCCSCLLDYDRCIGAVPSGNTVGQQTCLNQFYTCSEDSFDVFFNCNNRLNYDRHVACMIRYF